MREIRIYQPGMYQEGALLALSLDAAHHVATVLRMQPGQPITLFNGEDDECVCVIDVVQKKNVTVRQGPVVRASRESHLQIHLGQAISKGDRMDFVMQKATELGVASITPLVTDFCAVKLDKDKLLKKVAQWQAMVVSACEQSLRNKVPKVHDPMLLTDYLAHAEGGAKFLLHPRDAHTLADCLPLPESVVLLIGPEGGFSDMEVQAAKQHRYVPLSLGPRILRTETAAMSALSILQAYGGDLCL